MLGARGYDQGSGGAPGYGRAGLASHHEAVLVSVKQSAERSRLRSFSAMSAICVAGISERRAWAADTRPVMHFDDPYKVERDRLGTFEVTASSRSRLGERPCATNAPTVRSVYQPFGQA